MNSEHFTYLQEPGEESSQTFCLDTYLLGLARSKPTREIYSSPDKETECSHDSLYGGTSVPLTESLGAEQLTFFAADSPAKILVIKGQTMEKSKESTEAARGFGASIAELSKRCSLVLSLPRTLRTLELADLSESSKTLPVWGIMQDGVVWELATSEQTTRESASGLLPTVLATDWKGGCTTIRKDKGKQRFDQWRDYVKIMFGMTYPHPTHSELRMGWPENWTGSEPLGTDKFQRWLALHGLSSPQASGWQVVSFAADCIQSPEWEGTDEPGDICSICGLDYCDECQCPGPTQDGMEYEYFGDVLMARPILSNVRDQGHLTAAQGVANKEDAK
jgi:hypothetical protein